MVIEINRSEMESTSITLPCLIKILRGHIRWHSLVLVYILYLKYWLSNTLQNAVIRQTLSLVSSFARCFLHCGGGNWYPSKNSGQVSVWWQQKRKKKRPCFFVRDWINQSKNNKRLTGRADKLLFSDIHDMARGSPLRRVYLKPSVSEGLAL